MPVIARALLSLLICTTPLVAQTTGTITGTILADGYPVANARVSLTPIHERPPSSAGVIRPDSAFSSQRTTPTGAYTFSSVPFGRYLVRVTALGYALAERMVTLSDTTTRPLVVALIPNPIQANAVIVTGTMRETYVAESPVKVQVITSQFLERNRTNNLMESIQAVNGLSQQIDCGVCYTNNIRINGMEGPYTAVLIDGMPIMGALASVYGLNGINPILIERLEIIKGPSSTLYGSEAMGGVVNVITKDPRFTPRWLVNTSASSRGEQNLDLAISPRTGSFATLFSASYYNMPQFVDRNGDNFSDLPIGHRLSMFGKLLYQDYNKQPLLGLAIKLYDEDRFGGVREWTKSDRGSNTIYGESIRTRRGEVLGTQSLDALLEGTRLQFSFSTHHQDSYYGATPFRATQVVGHTNLLWNKTLQSRHTLLGGVSLRYNQYHDNTPASTGQTQHVIPGILLEDEFAATDRITLLLGGRIDQHTSHGLIAAPRASVKWDAADHTTLRINVGTGFRVVNLFTEDHAALSGTREVIIEDALRPERSASVSLNLNQVLEFGVNNMMIDVDAFYTRFTNKIVPDYDRDPGKIVYGNLNGSAVTRGIALALNQNFTRLPLLYSIGMTVQDVFTTNNGTRSREFFATQVQGNLSASYTFTNPRIAIDYTGMLTGSMRLPQYAAAFARPTSSPTHTVHNLQTSYTLRNGMSLYGAIKNLFNYTQGTPLIDPQNPYGPNFDTNYVWGPIQGRYLMFGLRYGATR